MTAVDRIFKILMQRQKLPDKESGQLGYRVVRTCILSQRSDSCKLDSPGSCTTQVIAYVLSDEICM